MAFRLGFPKRPPLSLFIHWYRVQVVMSSLQLLFTCCATVPEGICIHKPAGQSRFCVRSNPFISPTFHIRHISSDQPLLRDRLQLSSAQLSLQEHESWRALSW
ncbi:hypothetical protein BJX99DRAFT_233699 [Aspergillus californicus]